MKKWLYNTLIGVFATIFLGSAGYLAYYFINSHMQENAFYDLSQNMKENTAAPRPSVNENDTLADAELPRLVEITDPETGEVLSVLPRFQDLYVQNNHIVGWIAIPGTKIDYPVMQTPASTDFYLKRGFDRNSSKHGCIYAREVCDVTKPSDNITIYGHHMRDGSMFAALDNYTDKAFWEANPYIYFDTLTELHTYKIMAVFRTTASVGKGFAYHEFVDAGDEKAFQSFVDTCKELAIYDTGVEAAMGDTFITLSTCEYSQVNGRLVVVAKRLG